ncbi:MAG: alpha/beta hydrolase [Ferruginibacter sp.]
MKLTATIWTGLLVLLVSCSKNDINPVPPVTPPVTLAASTMMNVPYGSDPFQKMDVYLPPGRTTAATKLMIIVHGGGWSGGDKSDMTQYVDTFQKRLPGYAVVNINYRLATFSSNSFPTQENDVRSAVDFVYNKRNEYNISDKFVLLGVSAGSHLSLLQAYKNAVPKIKAVVDFFGPVDMADMHNNPASPSAPAGGIALLLNGPPPSALYNSSSPLNYVTAQSPPTIILHGGIDNLVRYQQSVALRNKLLLNTVALQYVFYPSEGHGWIGANLIDSFDKVQAFLNQYVL